MHDLILGFKIKCQFCLVFQVKVRNCHCPIRLSNLQDHLISHSPTILNRLHTKQPSHPPCGSYSQRSHNNKLLCPGWLFGSMGQFCCQILLRGLHGFILTCTLVTLCSLPFPSLGSVSMSFHCYLGDKMSTSGKKKRLIYCCLFV